MNNSYVFEGHLEISAYFNNYTWQDWAGIDFLNYANLKNDLHISVKSHIHITYKACLKIIQDTNLPI